MAQPGRIFEREPRGEELPIFPVTGAEWRHGDTPAMPISVLQPRSQSSSCTGQGHPEARPAEPVLPDLESGQSLWGQS